MRIPENVKFTLNLPIAKLLMPSYKFVLPLAALLATPISTLTAQVSLTDAYVVERGATVVVAEYMRAAKVREESGWTLYSARNSVGLGHGVEIGAGASWMPGDDVQPLAMNPALKWRFLDLEKPGLSAAVGVSAFVSLARSPALKIPTWAVTYGVVEHTFGERGPTAALGAYALMRTRDEGDSRAGAVMSLSQEVSSAVELSASWVTGDNWFGYLSPGATISGGAYSLWLGYSRGNRPRANSGPALSFEFVL